MKKRTAETRRPPFTRTAAKGDEKLLKISAKRTTGLLFYAPFFDSPLNKVESHSLRAVVTF